MRAWVALRAQRRRRERAAAPAVEIPTPSIQSWNVVWNDVDGVLTATVTVGYEFVAELPVAFIEVWDGREVGSAVRVGTTPSD